MPEVVTYSKKTEKKKQSAEERKKSGRPQSKPKVKLFKICVIPDVLATVKPYLPATSLQRPAFPAGNSY